MISEFNTSGETERSVSIALEQQRVIAVQAERDASPVFTAEKEVLLLHLRRIRCLEIGFCGSSSRNGKVVHEIQLQDLDQTVPKTIWRFTYSFNAYKLG